jgi:hypothetical protein
MMVEMANPAELEAKLREVLESWPLPIADDCKSLLEGAMRQGALRAAAEDQSPWPERVTRAEENFRKLMTEMTWQAGAMGFAELHEPTFYASLQKLCPLWPFC